MTLSFSTVMDGKPNFFVQKIWKGIKENIQLEPLEYSWYELAAKRQFNLDIGVPYQANAKIHTIRHNIDYKWKVGKSIHFVINNRTANRFQFAPVIKCTGVQDIWICHSSEGSFVKIDGKQINSNQLHNLAINDGFESIDDFFKYFKKNFYGILIHWTDLKYLCQ